jgi:outer membrane protein assembly factor BamB
VSIKGTLETFNLRELLQMLAFNQKVGTLVLETDHGPRTAYLEDGRLALVTGDPLPSDRLLRVVRRRALVPADRIDRPVQIHKRSGRFLGDILVEMGLLDADGRRSSYEEALGEILFELALSQIHRFEFVEGKTLAPGGAAGEAIEPSVVVESLLLDLTRKLDQWSAYCEVIPGLSEVFEGTGLSVDLAGSEEVDPALVDRVLPHVDGFRTLEDVAAESDVDALSVMTIAVALFQSGGIRPVSAEDLLARGEDLLSRGEAHQALPLLRRAIERGDAPPATRLRLADALEASGQPALAAAELETYVSTMDESRPAEVFDALARALRMREGDPATAARVCDYYLRNRPWLKERRGEALETLRRLIHGAVTERRPLDAAHRLAEFIQNGDAPSEDLLVLADLFSAGGQPAEAASALFRRAEDLLVAGRVAPARELLQRVLNLDPGRGDARNRLRVLQGEDRKRRQKKRVVVFLLLLGLLLIGAGAAWWTYNQQAGDAVRSVREAAERAMDDVEAKARGLLGAFETRVATAATSETVDEGLATAARDLVASVSTALQAADADIYAFATELERYNATNHRDTGMVLLRHLEARRRQTLLRAESVVQEVLKRARESLDLGERRHTEGRFGEARAALITARNLALDDAAIRSRADLLLRHVNAYREAFLRAQSEVEAARAAGDVERTFRLGVQLLADKMDSDLTRGVLLPVAVETNPPGATVILGGEPTGDVTPCVVEYSPFDASVLSLQMPGRVPFRMEMPRYDRIQQETERVLAWRPFVSASLPPGPRWTIPAAHGPFTEMTQAAGVPVLLTDRGTNIVYVDAEEGRPGRRVRIDRAQPARRLGTLQGGFEWRILGQRTLLVRPPESAPWEVQLLGRLEREPAIDGGTLAVVDELGRVTGYDATTGSERWRQTLGGPPSQAPRASKIGFLLTTATGSAIALDPASGEPLALAAALGANALALPLGDGALVIGTGEKGARVHHRDGTTTVLGSASPLAGREPWVGPEGVAWIEADGVRWVVAGGTATVPVRGLVGAVQGIGGEGKVLYAMASDGTLSAASAEAPETTLWRTALSGTSFSAPMPLGRSLYVLVDGGLVAVTR